MSTNSKRRAKKRREAKRTDRKHKQRLKVKRDALADRVKGRRFYVRTGKGGALPQKSWT